MDLKYVSLHKNPLLQMKLVSLITGSFKFDFDASSSSSGGVLTSLLKTAAATSCRLH
jgi:hypothetical protein